MGIASTSADEYLISCQNLIYKMEDMNLQKEINELFHRQLENWPLAKKNYEALKQVRTKTLEVHGCSYQVQFNPARMVSSAAKVDAKSISERKCFLCSANLPAEQEGIPFLEHYRILVNPFPIFPRHLTIPDVSHTPQCIEGRLNDMLALAQALPEFVIFYNGPRCGASAPDHAHFQAGNKGFLPLEKDVEQWVKKERNFILIKGETQQEVVGKFESLFAKGEPEPMMNLLAWFDESGWILCVFPRCKHRPTCYEAEGSERLLISPASVDMGGVFITPREEDFEKITAQDLKQILEEVCLYPQEPQVQVGIIFEPSVCFDLHTPYVVNGLEVSGMQTATYDKGKICWQGASYDELYFEPKNLQSDSFTLKDVTIGVNFHWERKEDQRFQGALRLIVEEGKITAINVLPVEYYLTSVISSEMSATASLELLKAHAVISRSWLLAQIDKKDETLQLESEKKESIPLSSNNPFELIKWYDREDHIRFDVCADDHCQRYQGITRASTKIVGQAIESTRGQVLMHDGKICDARFSKCCGGAFEEFQYCWEDVKHPYLVKQRDSKSQTVLPDLTCEEEAERWIRTSPEAFCNTVDKRVLGQVLNNYDQETSDFYRWKVVYSQAELSALIRERSGMDYGDIVDLIPVARGTSGRLWKLQIVGTKQTLTIGKELEIRRTLSSSHLYSSAFVVDKEGLTSEGVPARFILTGAGWGHGVGLCQIGAAVMGEQGYDYKTILLHYYIGAAIDKLY